MKEGRTLTELATELERQLHAKRDYLADSRIIEMQDDGKLVIPVNGHSEAFGLKETAASQMAQRLEIPKKYWDSMAAQAPELLATNVNHWLQAKPSRNTLRTLDGNLRAFLSDKFRPLDNYDLAETVLPVLLESGSQVMSCEVTDSRLYLKAVTPKIEGEVAVGDVVQAGIVISNSEVGMGSLSASLLIYRLSCTNGMIAGRDYGMRRTHTGKAFELDDAIAKFYSADTRRADDNVFWAKLRDMVQGFFSADGFNSILQRLRDAKEEKITGDVVKVVEVAARTIGFNDTERSGVLRHLIEGADLSRYGLMNAITRQSQDIEDYDRATDFEKFGGQIIELPRNQWSAIAQAA